MSNDRLGLFLYNLGKPFDVIFHSNIYKSGTSFGPLQVPDSYIEKFEDGFVESIKKVTNYSINIFKTKENQNDIEEIQSFVRLAHYPSHRNWTQAVNGCFQGFSGICLALFFKKPLFYSPLMIASNLWFGAGVRHLLLGQYDSHTTKKLINDSQLKKF